MSPWRRRARRSTPLRRRPRVFRLSRVPRRARHSTRPRSRRPTSRPSPLQRRTWRHRPQPSFRSLHLLHQSPHWRPCPLRRPPLRQRHHIRRLSPRLARSTSVVCSRLRQVDLRRPLSPRIFSSPTHRNRRVNKHLSTHLRLSSRLTEDYRLLSTTTATAVVVLEAGHLRAVPRHTQKCA